MPGGNKNIRASDNPKPYVKGQKNPNGGRKKRFVTLMKEKGFSRNDIQNSIQNVAAMTDNELVEHLGKKELTILEKIVIKTFQSAEKNGNYDVARNMLEMGFDKPTAGKEVTHNVDKALTEQFNEIFKIGGRDIKLG